MKNREIAMVWWNDLCKIEKISLSFSYFKRSFNKLTGREIQHIWEDKDELIIGLMESTFHCDDETAKNIVDKYVEEHPNILLFFELSYLYKI